MTSSDGYTEFIQYHSHVVGMQFANQKGNHAGFVFGFGLVGDDDAVAQHVHGHGPYVVGGDEAAVAQEGVRARGLVERDARARRGRVGDERLEPIETGLGRVGGRDGARLVGRQERIAPEVSQRRHARHETFGLLVLERILTPEVTAWLVDADPEILQGLLAAVAGIDDGAALGTLVADADRASVERDLRERLMPSGRPIDKGWLSSKYGKRIDPFSGKQELHRGIDIAGKEGSRILAVGDGVIWTP